MRCFVTGATGFIGGRVARRLVGAGHRVAGLTSDARKCKKLAAAAIRPVVGDIRRPNEWLEHTRDADVLVHAAVLPTPSFRPGRSDGNAIARADRAAATALAEVAAAGRAKLLLYTSGIGMYGPTRNPVSEEAPPRPFRLYAPRAATEAWLLDRAARDGVPVCIMRPGATYGNDGIFAKLFYVPMSQGKRVRFPGDGSQVFSFIHPDDAAAAYLAAVEALPRPGSIFNVVDDEPAEMGVVLRSLAAALDAPEPRGLPPFLIRMMTGLMADPLLAGCVASSRRAVAELGWRPRFATYREGIAALALERSRGGVPGRPPGCAPPAGVP